MAELMTTTQTAQNDLKAKTNTKQNPKNQRNESKRKRQDGKRHKREYDVPPAQVQIDPTRSGALGVSRANFAVSGTVQPGLATVYGYLYQRVPYTRYPVPPL